MPTKSPQHNMNGKPHRKRLLITLVILFFIIIIVSVASILIFHQNQKKLASKKLDLDRISQESYDGIFVSMYPITGYNEEDFTTFRGVRSVLSTYTIPRLADISEYLEAAFSSDNTVTNIYLGLDPNTIWNNCNKKENKWSLQLENYLIPYLVERPNTAFEIMLPYPDMNYWTAMTDAEMNMVLNTYRKLLISLEPYSNVTTYFVGAEYWLIANPGNYDGNFQANPEISQKLMLLTFCDRQFQITTTNADTFFNNLTALALHERTSSPDYPDLSQWQLVFFGDSIIGNYQGSHSIPGVVSGLTEASSYNYAIGGTQAADMADYDNSFPDMVERFLAQELAATQDGTEFPYTSLENNDKKLCFLINYGLNDYFNGVMPDNSDNAHDINTFSGSLRVGVQHLREAYPDALILLMTPPFCTYFSNGMDKNSEVGGILTDYVTAVEQVAEEENVICMNNYTGLGITEANSSVYLADGCHLNENGRFVLGTQIISTLEQANVIY